METGFNVCFGRQLLTLLFPIMWIAFQSLGDVEYWTVPANFYPCIDVNVDLSSAVPL